MAETIEQTTDSTLENLARRIRASQKAVETGARLTLAGAFDAGDALIAAKPLASSGFQKWVCDACGIRLSTAKLYMKLARHRAEIEAKIERVGELSLRGACRLISGRGSTRVPKSKLPLLMAWRLATRAERMAALSAIDTNELLEALPPDVRVEIQAHVASYSINNPSKLTVILRKCLSLVKTASMPSISETMAVSNKHEALACLQQLLALLARYDVDLNEVALMGQAKSKSQRPAA